MSQSPYPPDHAIALNRVLRVLEIISANFDVSDETVIEQLIGEGIGPVDADLLVRFVPCAVSYPVVVHMGATYLPAHYSVQTRAGRFRLLKLQYEHYFTAALSWTENLLAMQPAERPLSIEAFNAVVARSSVLDAARKIIDDSGPDGLQGCVFGPLALSGITLEDINESRGVPTNRPWWKVW